ncbi:MAG: hypothetical protein IKB52_01455 [Kiritimatiellae bacterium]|nr:hypothetical protein [Kiritimatiellia bacterium]
MANSEFLTHHSEFTAPGWERDENGALRRVKKPHMGRRLPGFDYSQRIIYEITIVLKERRPVLGRLVKKPCESAALEDGAGNEPTWVVEPSAMGQAALDCWRKITDFWPQVSLIEAQLMPEHFHGILFVKERLPLTHPNKPEGPDNRRKNLGDIIRGFKVGCTMAWRGLINGGEYVVGPNLPLPAVTPRRILAAAPQWAEGFVDTILFHKGQLAKMINYLRDNPRRLGVKRDHPELFKVARDIEIAFNSLGDGGAIAPWRGPSSGHFAAIGNHFLLSRPRLVQVQCSRGCFRYRREYAAGPDCEYAAGRNGKPRICRDKNGNPVVEHTTPEFEAKLNEALSAASHGAVLVSPCISHGEREIARQAFEAGYRVVTMQNKGFSPLYKPGGKLFEACAHGNLLMLAPVNWPYQPAEKQMTRDDAQTLNRIAQLIAGDGAVEIKYNGAVMSGVDESVVKATN